MKIFSDPKTRKKFALILACVVIAVLAFLSIRYFAGRMAKAPEHAAQQDDAAPVLKPAVLTLPATGVTASEAVINGRLVSTGGMDTTVGFFYEGTPNDASIMSAPGNFSVHLTKLNCGETYSFDATAKNSAGETDGPTRVFTTLACSSSKATTPAKTTAKSGSSPNTK